jgi:glycosyltransferase involved in cell wall biosynthesis
MRAAQSNPAPTVSVIIPSYNTAGSIKPCVDSVLAQTYRDFEAIVVNDGSPDTPELERALERYLDRIRYIKQENRGPSGARNTGILQARGRYVAFLDSDDFWYPDHLASQMEMLLGDESLGLVYSDYHVARHGVTVGRAFEREPQSRDISFRSLLVEDCSIGTSSAVVCRQAILDAGMFDENLRRCEDFHLWLRLAHRGVQMRGLMRVTLCHVEGKGLASDRYLLNRARIDVYEKIRSALLLEDDDLAVIGALIKRVKADCELDLAREFLRTKRYREALAAAERANSFLERNWKLRLALIGLRRFPSAVRQFSRLRQWGVRRYRHLLGPRIPIGVVPSPGAVASQALVRAGFRLRSNGHERNVNES